ncbi:MAG: ATP phosphoribosyltransferase [Prevotellaceae bacterium]|nr:ATP phosphoribosyltransferase [Prevotellaceae bacterium]
MLRIAVQSKGRLHDDSMALLAEAGIRAEGGKRTLLERASGFAMEVLYLRDDDIPQCVATGVADLGIVGKNELEERQEDVKTLRPLGFGKCRLSLAIPKAEAYDGLEWFSGKKIATSYPRILRRFLQEKELGAEVHEIAGSVEVCPGIGLADAIFDIVSSGSTLVSNNLKEVECVMDCEALLIAGKHLSHEREAEVDELLFRLEAVRNAEDKKYVLMNVPSERLAEVVAVLPGAKSPTVMPLATEGWNSVHTVIEEKRLWTIVRRLKELGAQGILVVPIEKMIP